MKLHSLKPAQGSTKNKKRVGRGPGSGNGTTAGKGNKGQQARSGYATSYKEGGQMPLYRRAPKFGFTNPFKQIFSEINLAALAMYIKKGILKEKITLQDLVDAHIVGKRSKVKILGNGDGLKVDIEVHAISAAAKEKIEKSNGKVTLIK